MNRKKNHRTSFSSRSAPTAAREELSEQVRERGQIRGGETAQKWSEERRDGTWRQERVI